MSDHDGLNCELRYVKCNYCEEFYYRKSLESHKLNHCRYRPVLCEFCCKFNEEEEMPICELAEHKSLCLNAPVSCKAGPKCRENLTRRELQQHESVCQEVKVQCTGQCGQMVARKHFNKLGEHNCVEYLVAKLYK